MDEIITNTQNEHKKTCFIITPIGKETDPIRRHIDGIIEAVIEPVLKEQNFEIVVPHYMALPGSIDKQIIKQIYQSDIVIANLTNVNPNVMYELALRHCFGTPLIIIAEKETVLPFDIGNQRTIFYINDAKGVLKLKTDLTNAINELSNDGIYESPVISVVKELGVEELIISDKTTNSDKNEVNAWGVIFERLDRIEQKIYTIINGNELKSETVTSIQTEREILITGEEPISYRVRDSLRFLLNTMDIDYVMERSADDMKMSAIIQFPLTKNWRHFFKTVNNICKAYNLKVETIR